MSIDVQLQADVHGLKVTMSDKPKDLFSLMSTLELFIKALGYEIGSKTLQLTEE